MKTFFCFFSGKFYQLGVSLAPRRLVFEGPTDVPKTESESAPKEKDARSYGEKMVEAKVDFDTKRQELAAFVEAHAGSSSTEVKNSAGVVKNYLQQLEQAEANKKYLDVKQLQANVQRMDKMLSYFEMVQPLEAQKAKLQQYADKWREDIQGHWDQIIEDEKDYIATLTPNEQEIFDGFIGVKAAGETWVVADAEKTLQKTVIPSLNQYLTKGDVFTPVVDTFITLEEILQPGSDGLRSVQAQMDRDVEKFPADLEAEKKDIAQARTQLVGVPAPDKDEQQGG